MGNVAATARSWSAIRSSAISVLLSRSAKCTPHSIAKRAVSAAKR